MAQQIFKEVTLDVARKNTLEAIVAKQYDNNSRYLKVHLVNEGAPITVESGATVLINALRADNASMSFSGSCNSDGTINVPITAWMLELDDTVMCDVSVIGRSSSKLSTTWFEIFVERSSNNSSGQQPSQQEANLILDLISQQQSLKSQLKATLNSCQTTLAQCQEALNGLTKGPIQSTEGSNLNARLVALETWKTNVEAGETMIGYGQEDTNVSLADVLKEDS